MLPLCVCVLNLKLSRHHMSKVYKAMKKDISKKKEASKTIGRLVSLGLSEQRVLSFAHSSTVCLYKSDRYRNSVLQTVARAGPRTLPGWLTLIISWEGKRSNCIPNQVSHFYFLLMPTLFIESYEGSVLPPFGSKAWFVFFVWLEVFWAEGCCCCCFFLLLVKFDQRPMAVFTVERFYIFLCLI